MIQPIKAELIMNGNKLLLELVGHLFYSTVLLLLNHLIWVVYMDAGKVCTCHLWFKCLKTAIVTYSIRITLENDTRWMNFWKHLLNWFYFDAPETFSQKLNLPSSTVQKHLAKLSKREFGFLMSLPWEMKITYHHLFFFPGIQTFHVCIKL